MFAQLDRIDLTVSTPAGEATRFVQCDHREPAEIGTREALSTVLAVLKVAVARAKDPNVPVEYTCEHEPPAFLVAAVVAAGGVVRRSGSGPTQPPPPSPVDTAFIDHAFATLAAEAALARAVPTSGDGLKALEETVIRSVKNATRRTDELTYWTAVVELAAICGELLRPLAPGGWRYAADVHPPFVYELDLPDGGTMRVNPLGKAQKLIESGPVDSVASLASSAKAYLTSR